MAGKVITIAQQKGGSGKTTLAAQLGVACHTLGRRVALVDIDPQGSLARWFELRTATLGADKVGVTFSAVTGWRGPAEVDRLKRDYDLVVIDSPPHAQSDTRTAIRAANLVVAPVQPSPLDFWATSTTIELAAAEQRPVLLVLNRMPSRRNTAAEPVAAIREMGAAIARTSLGNRSNFSTAMAQGLTIGETAPDSMGAREAAKLAREILTRLGG